MEVVRVFCNLFARLSTKTPAAAFGVFLIVAVFFSLLPPCQATVVWTGDVWPDRPHPAVGYISCIAGGGYSVFMPSGYNVKSVNSGHFIVDVELYASRNIPIFSKARWQSSETFRASEEPMAAESENPAGYDGFVEFRMPFTATFLSYNTSWFIQYERLVNRFNGVLSSGTQYSNGMYYYAGDKVTMSKQLQKVAIAIDTPITGEDSPYSYSRFGLYYVQNIRPRNARRPDEMIVDGWLLKVLEQHGGFFYDINKPVFASGFILRFYLSFGFGQQEALPNSYGIVNSEFKASNTLFFTDVNIGAAYRKAVTKWMGALARIDYGYSGITPLNSVSNSVSKYNNNPEQFIRCGLALDFIL